MKNILNSLLFTLSWAKWKLRLQLLIKFSDTTHFRLYFFSFTSDSSFLLVHSVSHFAKNPTLSLKISILLLQNRFLLIKELSEIIKFAFFKHLKAFKCLTDFIRWRNFAHPRNRLCQKMILRFNKSLIVSQQMSQLLDWSNFWILVINSSCRVSTKIQSFLCISISIKNLKWTNLFVYSVHKFTKTLEILSKLGNKLFATILEILIKKFITNGFNLCL